MNKRFQVWLPLLLAVVMVGGMITGYQLQKNMGRHASGSSLNGASSEVLELIQEKYVDKENMDSLNRTALEAVLDKLDPHSIYIPAVRLGSINDELRGSLTGIGIRYEFFNDTLNIIDVLEGGPAAAAGLLPADQVIKIGDTLVAGRGKTAEQIHNMLGGDETPSVTFTLWRNSKSVPITIKKGMVAIPSLDAAYMAAPGVGYIRLNKFAGTTYAEFMKAMGDLDKQGMKKLILDLRDNGGGVLDAAVNIADEFLEDGKMIVYTEGDKVKRKDYKSTKPGIFEKGALVVLTNELSASASEVLSGALQDNDRCSIVGRRSFGKGLVQEQYQLSDGGALRLTVARYYTPLGRSIQRSYAGGHKAYDNEIIERYHHMRDSIANDSAYTAGKMYTTPAGKKVYGGGGISPDVYVPFGADTLSAEGAELFSGNTLFDFTYRYYRQNRAALQSFKTPRAFEASYTLPESTWNSLVAFAHKDSLNLPLQDARLKTESLERIKSIMARQIWHTEGYYEIENASDPTYKKALQVIAAMP